jgi:hypothetical protein
VKREVRVLVGDVQESRIDPRMVATRLFCVQTRKPTLTAREQFVMFEEVTIATFDKRQEAEESLRALDRDGLAINKMSIVAVDPYTEERAMRYYRTGERVLVWAGGAALWGVLWGLFAGPLFVHVPGYGPLPGIIHFPSGLGHFFSSRPASICSCLEARRKISHAPGQFRIKAVLR